jgi:transcriptional regulator GlxA family with amidase domain
LQLVIQLLRHPSELAMAPQAAKGGLSAHQLRRAIELLEADLTRTPSLHQLAAHSSDPPDTRHTDTCSIAGWRMPKAS